MRSGHESFHDGGSQSSSDDLLRGFLMLETIPWNCTRAQFVECRVKSLQAVSIETLVRTIGCHRVSQSDIARHFRKSTGNGKSRSPPCRRTETDEAHLDAGDIPREWQCISRPLFSPRVDRDGDSIAAKFIHLVPFAVNDGA